MMSDAVSHHISGPEGHAPPEGGLNCGFIFLEPRNARTAFSAGSFGSALFEKIVAKMGRSKFSHVGMFAVGHEGIDAEIVWVDAATHDVNTPAIHIRRLEDIPTDRKAHWIGYRHDGDSHRPGELCAHFVERRNDLTLSFDKGALAKMAWLRVVSYLTNNPVGALRRLIDANQDGSDVFCSEFVASSMVTSVPNLTTPGPGQLWVPVDPAWMQIVKEAVDESHQLYKRRAAQVLNPPYIDDLGGTDRRGIVEPGEPDHPYHGPQVKNPSDDPYWMLSVLGQPEEDPNSPIVVELPADFDIRSNWLNRVEPSKNRANEISRAMFDLDSFSLGGGFSGRDGGTGEPFWDGRDDRRILPLEPPAGFRENLEELAEKSDKARQVTWLEVGWRKGQLPPFLVMPQHLFEHRGEPPDQRRAGSPVA